MARRSAGVEKDVVNSSSKKYYRLDDKDHCFSHGFVVLQSVQLAGSTIAGGIDHDVDVLNPVQFLLVRIL